MRLTHQVVRRPLSVLVGGDRGGLLVPTGQNAALMFCAPGASFASLASFQVLYSREPDACLHFFAAVVRSIFTELGSANPCLLRIQCGKRCRQKEFSQGFWNLKDVVAAITPCR